MTDDNNAMEINIMQNFHDNVNYCNRYLVSTLVFWPLFVYTDCSLSSIQALT